MFDYYNMQVALVVPFPLISPNVLRSYHRMMPIKTEFYSELRFLCLVLFLSVWVFLIIFFIFLAIKFILFDNNLSSINNRKIFLVILRRFQACSRKKKMKKILWSCRYAEYENFCSGEGRLQKKISRVVLLVIWRVHFCRRDEILGHKLFWLIISI